MNVGLGAPVPDDLADLGQRGRGGFTGALGAGGQHPVDFGRIGHQAAHFGADRTQLLDRQIGELRLEGAKALAGELGQHFG